MDQRTEYHCERSMTTCKLPPQKSGLVISLDGPAASGKSTVARLLAQKLDFVFISSGYYYRALAWSALQQQFDLSQEKKIASWLATLDLKMSIVEGKAHLLLNGINLKNQLFDPSVNALVSPLAALPAIRFFLLTKLRNLALDHNLVMEGRDIGSVVFPNTPFKFYLHASLEERIRRRHKEGEVDAIAVRDQSDSSRAVAPLLIPEGATAIDTTHLNIEEVIKQLLHYLEKAKIGE